MSTVSVGQTPTSVASSSRHSSLLGQRPPEVNLEFLSWSEARVAEWVEEIGFPQYKPCFNDNLINGRKLIFVTASNLPKLGVTDFEHIQEITLAVRRLLGIDKPDSLKSVASPRCSELEMFLERKSQTGTTADGLVFRPSTTTINGAVSPH